jgi:hypothetical protein
MAFRYSVCSGVQAAGPAVPAVALGDAVWASDEPEHAVKVSANNEVATISFLPEEVIFFT